MRQIQEIRDECLVCRRCKIGRAAILPDKSSNVFSNMNVGARIMVIGQNPGREEVDRGEPFVGPSGRFFDEAINRILGLSRNSFYITNVVHCFTPSNRHPFASEIDNCRVFLDAEVAIVKPALIIALGALSFKQLTGMGGISKHHGEVIFSPRYAVDVIPLLHPSPYNTNNPTKRAEFYDDLGKIHHYMEEHRIGNK